MNSTEHKANTGRSVWGPDVAVDFWPAQAFEAGPAPESFVEALWEQVAHAAARARVTGTPAPVLARPIAAFMDAVPARAAVGAARPLARAR